MVKVTEGSLVAAHRCLHRREDRVSTGMQQLRLIINMLATAKRVAVGQQATTDVLRSLSKRRRDVTEEDATTMACRYAYVLLH